MGLGDNIVENGIFQGTIDTWLQTGTTFPGSALHWAAIIASPFVNKKKLEYPETGGGVQDLGSTVLNVATLGATGVASAMSGLMNKMFVATKDPNLEGIPIISPNITVSREVEVSEYGVIMDAGYMKKNVVDNAVPKPRVWNVNGYLTSKWDMDVGMVLKPSLVMQTKTLDAFAKSRKPLWFKTDEFEFVQVQITNLTVNRKAEIMNAYEVSLTLKEFTPLEIFSGATFFQKAAFILSH